MKKGIFLVLIILCISGLEATRISAQVASASDNLIAQPVPDRTVLYNVSDTGESKPITWGLDLAWLSEGNILRGIAFMGADRVDIIRSSFTPTSPLVNGELQAAELTILNQRLDLIDLFGRNMNLVLNCDHPSVDPWYVGNAENWAQLIDVTTRLHQERGHTVVSVSPFNEPDFGWGQGTIEDFYNIAGVLRSNPLFDSIRISGGNTLNCDEAFSWYNYLKNRLDEGNTHQLAGSFNNFASFYQAVRANGDHATGDELHNVMEAMVGVEYGLQTGIWWGTAELARGEFVKASDGKRLGYAEHRPNWTAASVYRSPEGKIQAFGGTSERQAVTTSYRFVSLDRDVYYDGYGPQREYTMVLPGGTGYQQGQTNAERVVNITWGDDIQPVIDGRYVLVNRNSGKVMEVADGSVVAGANIQQGTNTGATYQQWNVTPVDSRIGGDFSYFTFTAVHSGKSPDILNWSLDNGGNILAWNDTKGGNQQWYLQYAGDGWFYIRSRHSAKCLEVASASTANGANIQQWELNGATCQQWRFYPVGVPVEFNPPTSPGNLVATPQAESVRLDWSASSSSDVSGYNIYRSESAGGPYNTIARNITVTSFVDNTTTMGGQYFYIVRAMDNSLNCSSKSSEVSAIPTGMNDLVVHLKFDGNIQDNSVNLNHGASRGGTMFTEGRVGSQAITLNGTDAFVQLPATIANQQEITITTWVNWNGGNAWQRIFDFGNDQTKYLFLSPSSGLGQLRFAIKNDGAEQILSAPALANGQWTHLAVTLGEYGAGLYVNGQLVDEDSAITISPIDFKPVLNYIGRGQNSVPLFNGTIDDFRVYNYVLSEEDITTLAAYNNMDSVLVSGNVYSLESKLSGKVIEIFDNETTSGSLIVQNEYRGDDNQKWLLLQDNEGYWRLTSESAPDKVLDVPDCKLLNGIQLDIWYNLENDCQKYHIEDLGNSYFQVRTKDGLKCIDVNGESTENLAEIILWDCNIGDSQQWRLINFGKNNTAVYDEGNCSVLVNAFPNPVETDLYIEIENFSGQVYVEIYGIDGSLEKQQVMDVSTSGQIIIPNWGYKGLGIVKVITGQETRLFKMSF